MDFFKILKVFVFALILTKIYLGTKYNPREPFIPQVGLVYVRGCEVEGMLDANGRVIEDGPDPRPQLPGEQRTYRVWLDCNQYRMDMDSLQEVAFYFKDIISIKF